MGSNKGLYTLMLLAGILHTYLLLASGATATTVMNGTFTTTEVTTPTVPNTTTNSGNNTSSLQPTSLSIISTTLTDNNTTTTEKPTTTTSDTVKPSTATLDTTTTTTVPTTAPTQASSGHSYTGVEAVAGVSIVLISVFFIALAVCTSRMERVKPKLETYKRPDIESRDVMEMDNMDRKRPYGGKGGANGRTSQGQTNSAFTVLPS